MNENEDFNLFVEKNLDQAIQLFEWFKPEDLYFIGIFLTIFSPLINLAYLLLDFDIFYLFGKNGILKWEFPKLLYLIFTTFFVPTIYLVAMKFLRKRYSPGFFGRRTWKVFNSRLSKHYIPIRDKDLLNEGE